MKTYVADLYVLLCNENGLYKDDIIKTLDTRIKDIADFFGVEKLDNPIVVKIYNSRDLFRDYLIPYLYDGKYYDWMIGSTHDGNINMLSIDCCRQTIEHADITLEQYLNNIMHEVVHKMHHIIKGNNETKNSWFHEALATNLSKQDYQECIITCTLEKLKQDYNSVENQYSISYTLGKYLLENYSHDFIIAMCKDESILDEFAPKLFEEVIDYQECKKYI